MKLKTVEIDGKTYAVVDNGLPVYVHDDGKEVPFDAAGTVSTIKARNAEAKANRERAEAAEAKLAKFDGIADADAAVKALDVVAKLDQKKLIDAGQVDAAVSAALKPVQDKLDAETKRSSTLEQQLHGEIVGGAFARSKFIGEKLAIPSDMVQAAFGRHFAVKDGKLAATSADGNPIYSRKNPGAAADFDEAMEILIDAYPHKDTILKADNASGSGTPTNGGGAHKGGAPKSLADCKTDDERVAYITSKST